MEIAPSKQINCPHDDQQNNKSTFIKLRTITKLKKLVLKNGNLPLT